MKTIILGSILIIATLLLNIIIDYFILKNENDILGFIRKIPKEKNNLLVYIFSILIQMTIFIVMGINPTFYLFYFVSLIFYRIAIIDYHTKYVDNKLLALLAIISVISLGVNNNVHMIEGILTGLATYIILAVFSKITRESFGMGDAKVLGLLGVIYGFQGLMSILLVSSAIVFFVSVFLLFKSKDNKNRELPFTPYIYASLIFMIIISNI